MPQPITTDHGVLTFVHIYKGQTARDPVTKVVIGQNGGIGELDSGAWVYFPKGQPIADPAHACTLLRSINPEAAARFVTWWEAEQTRRIEDETVGVARPIKIVACEEPPGSMLLFDDGTDEAVSDAGAVVAFFKTPGPLQSFAMQIFGARYTIEQAEQVRDELETPRAKLAREYAERHAPAKSPKKSKRRPRYQGGYTAAKRADNQRRLLATAGITEGAADGEG